MLEYEIVNTIESRLEELGIALPTAAAPAANYVPYVLSGNLLHLSGQLPIENGKLAVAGLVGRDVDLPAARRAAELCAVNLLAQARAALGDLSRIRRVVKIQGFVASAPDFTEQHLVVNGASDLLVAVLGDAGRHARAAVGMASLPLNAAVEVDAILEVV